MTIQSISFIAISSCAFGYSASQILTLFLVMKRHQGKTPSFRNLWKRILVTFVNVLGQKAVLQKKTPGIMHTTIFWGFIVITLGTLEQFFTTLLNDSFNFQFIGHTLYSILVFLQDFFTSAVLIAISYAFYRRHVIKPKELGKSRDANIILGLTTLLMISILLMNSFHILASTPWYTHSMPISHFFSQILYQTILEPLKITQTAYEYWFLLFKWTHMLLVMGFAVYIPSSKHLHTIAAGPNTFLKTLSREKPMSLISFDNESIQQYGAAKITDLSWKDALDYYSCTECGRCQTVCPAYNTDKPLSPKKLISDLKNNLYCNKTDILSKNYKNISPIINDVITQETIWACTSCRACEIACPVFIEHTNKIYDIRRNLVMMESSFPQEVQAVFKNLENNSSPWNFNPNERSNWADGLSIKKMSETSSDMIEILLWVGCAGSYDERNKKVVRAFTNILKKAGIQFAILGNEEKCTGDPARRIGNEYLYQILAKGNIETLNRYQIKKIVTACPHCFNVIKNEYPQLGGNYEVYHHSQLIAELIASKKIKPTQSAEKTVTFHDSCYLGRWNNIYKEPRSIIDSIPAIKRVEMKNSHDQSMCCGAGGGRMWMEEKTGQRINITRTEQAIETKANIIASSCPFCMTMMSDGVKSKDAQKEINVLDIAELIDQSTSSLDSH